MYMTSPKRKNGSTVVRLVVSFRKDGKVKNRIVKVIGQSKDPLIIEQYKKTARSLIDQYKKGLISFPQVSEKLPIDLYRFLGEDRFNTGFEDIFGSAYEQLGFKELIKSSKNNSSLNEVLRNLMLMRVFWPVSKLKSCHLLEEHFNKIVSHKQVLTMMDHLSKKENEIREQVFQSAFQKQGQMKMLLFDVTTLCFESVSADDLRDFGYSKDGKFNEVQVVLAVLANEDGLPLAYEVFPGHTGEGKTLQSVVSQAVDKHKVKRICVVADRAMFSDNNFAFFEDLKKEQGVKAQYVVSCPLKKLPKKIKEKILDFKNNREDQQNSKPAYYEFSYNHKLRAKDEKKRHKILQKLEGLCKEDKIPAGKMVKNTGYRRYLKTLKGSVEIDKEKIYQDSRWDGLYGVCSNREDKSPADILNSYRSLWKIEELFRINKHTLKMRPIYHRLSRRIRAHILICFLAYTVLKHTQIVLKKAGLYFSLQDLIDTLKTVESFIIRDKIKKPSFSYCIPRALSEPAQRIYTVFGKDYPKRPYKLERNGNGKRKSQ